MKNLYSMVALFLCIGMLLLPLVASKNEQEPNFDDKIESDEPLEDIFLVYDSENKSVIRLSAKDYITGVVLAEMPAEYEKEALKAQAVASYTFACYKRYLRQSSVTENPYDVTTESGIDQAYISEQKAKEKYGQDYEQYIAPIKQSVEEVLGEFLSYNDAPALTVYHSVSSGNTESAKDVWGEDYPYLQAVDSRLDLMADGYVSVSEFSAEQVETALQDLCASDKDYENWFKDTENTKSGMVLKTTVAGVTLKGTDIRKALNLRSSNFYVSFADNIFTFTVYGYGHGVGMSQYGANCMALKGNTYVQILEHYYKDCTLKKP